jgi:hypothetical protein
MIIRRGLAAPFNDHPAFIGNRLAGESANILKSMIGFQPGIP